MASSADATPVNRKQPQPAPHTHDQELDDAMPNFGDSCMDFDFIGS